MVVGDIKVNVSSPGVNYLYPPTPPLSPPNADRTIPHLVGDSALDLGHSGTGAVSEPWGGVLQRGGGVRVGLRYHQPEVVRAARQLARRVLASGGWLGRRSHAPLVSLGGGARKAWVRWERYLRMCVLLCEAKGRTDSDNQTGR